jgi:hypothetical protein
MDRPVKVMSISNQAAGWCVAPMPNGPASDIFISISNGPAGECIVPSQMDWLVIVMFISNQVANNIKFRPTNNYNAWFTMCSSANAVSHC